MCLQDTEKKAVNRSVFSLLILYTLSLTFFSANADGPSGAPSTGQSAAQSLPPDETQSPPPQQTDFQGIAPTFADPNNQNHPNTKSVFDSVSYLIFPIYTAPHSSSQKLSQGSGFVIARSGILVTSYEAVAKAITEPRKIKPYVEFNGRKLEARIIAFSVLRNLAALKIEQDFPGELQLSPYGISVGQRLFSVGQSINLSLAIIEQTFKGVQVIGPYKQLILSAPIDHDMNGGPVLNEAGALTGVNTTTALSGPNTSFAIPAHFISDLLAGAALDRSPAATNESGGKNDEITLDLTKAATLLTQNWMNEKNESIAFSSWKILAPPPGLNCMTEQKSGETFIDQMNCTSSFEVTPEPGVKAGNYQISYFNLSSLNPGSRISYKTLNNFYTSESTKMWQEFSLRTPSSNQTQNECSERIIANKNQIQMKLNYCASGYKKYAGLIDAIVKFITIEKDDKALMIVLRLNGFRPDHIKEIVNSLVESVEKAKL